MARAILVNLNDRRVEAIPCKKHEHYFTSGYLVLSCSKCVVRRLPVTPTENGENNHA